MSTRLSQAPPLWRLKKPETPKAPKALIVGSDYFALTSRIDPQVEFWSANQATKNPVATNHSIIPPGITILWVAPDIDGNVRTNLLSQAIVRGIEIWRIATTSLELREKLLPIWGHERNRTMVYPGIPEFDAREAEIVEREETPREKFLRERKARMMGYAERSLLKTAEAEEKAVSVPAHALAQLPVFDRKVYETFVRRDGKNGDRVVTVAAEFGLPPANVQRILERVQSKLAQG